MLPWICSWWEPCLRLQCASCMLRRRFNPEEAALESPKAETAGI